MAQSQFGSEIERLAAEYDAALKAMTENPLFSGDRKRLVYTANSGSIPLAERYEKARQNLERVGIKLESVLCVEPSSISSGVTTGFEGLDIRLMDPTSSWGQGYQALRDSCVADVQAGRVVVHPTYVLDGQTIYRPLTLGEDLRARIADAYTHNNNITQASSWSRWNDSCTAIIYGPNGLFKLQNTSPHLLGLESDFNGEFVPTDYNSIQGENVREFDRNNAKYAQALTQEEVLRHPFWDFVEPDNNILREYTKLLWSGRPGYKGMAIWLKSQPQFGELRALYVNSHGGNSSAYGNDNLDDSGSFLRVS